MERDDLLRAVLSCNGCGEQLRAGEVMVCTTCAGKLPAIPVTYSTAKPRDLSHVVPGTCSCECHDKVGDIRHFAPCCSQTYRPRAELVPLRKLPEPVIGDFSKFVMPLVRKKKS